MRKISLDTKQKRMLLGAIVAVMAVAFSVGLGRRVSAPSHVKQPVATSAAITSQSASDTAKLPVTENIDRSYAPWGDLPFYVNPNNLGASYVANDPGVSGAALITREGQVPTAEWFGGWNSDVQADADKYVTAATAANAVPVLIAYNIPLRDCGGYSGGGAQTSEAYAAWVAALASGIGNRLAVVIVEPDGLSYVDCLSASAQAARFSQIAQAVTTLKAYPNTYIYIEAAHANWLQPATVAARLKSANIALADGFAVNVSNFTTTASNITYGAKLSALVGNKHFIIDTSRNGNGPTADNQWCNPPGRALGTLPTTHTNNPIVDALVWAKAAWSSDGPCNGGPAAGQNFWAYAIQLAQNAGWQN